ncbi:MAG: site-specific DNA-methyltransferase [Bacillota bacterium]|nr:site-specific DNA-methyltransferase [Bacillota bacterium]
MSKVYDVLNAIENGRVLFEEIMNRESSSHYEIQEIYGADRSKGFHADADGPANLLASGDNLEFMEYLIKEKGMAGKIQLIYVDPPFFTNSKYQASVRLESSKLGKSPVIKTGAYDDKWEDSLEQYLSMLAVRFHMMRELLSDTGCIWVHLDWHGSHYVKMLLDEIFGEGNFINEIAWTYKSGGASKRSFARKHDTLLFYSKTNKYKFNILKEKSYNRQLKPYRFKGVEEFQNEIGWFTLVNMKDVWNIDMVGRTSSERTGYATQKPEKLIKRIINACSDPGDICADFFSGSGTLGAVCSKEDRPWIMCDEGNVATASQILRLSREAENDRAGRDMAFAVMRKAAQTEDPAGSYDDSSVIFSEELGCLRVINYKPDKFQLSENDEEIAARYIGEDGTSAIDFWSVDFDYDGRVHRSDEIVSKKDFCALREGNIHVTGYDVFGNRFQWQKKV